MTPTKSENDWKAESDARTLMDAEEVKQDVDRHGKAMKHINKKKEAIDSIAGLRSAAKSKREEEAEKDYVHHHGEKEMKQVADKEANKAVKKHEGEYHEHHHHHVAGEQIHTHHHMGPGSMGKGPQKDSIGKSQDAETAAMDKEENGSGY